MLALDILNVSTNIGIEDSLLIRSVLERIAVVLPCTYWVETSVKNQQMMWIFQ